MIDWNIVLYIGLVLIVFGFGLFLYSEIRIREIDRQIAINDKKINNCWQGILFNIGYLYERTKGKNEKLLHYLL